MRTYTKEQLIEEIQRLSLTNFTVKLISNHFNNLEKPQLEPWRWYVNAYGSVMLFDPYNYSNQIGFTNDGRFTDGFGTYGDWHPATKEQIEPLLRAEAKRRGLIEGAKYNSVPEFEGCSKNYMTRRNGYLIPNKPIYDFDDDCLFYGFGVLYEKGRWATLVEEKSLEDRIAELEKKVERLNGK